LNGATSLPLELSLVEPMGADSLLWGTIGKEIVSIRVGPDDIYHVGDKIQAFFLPSYASVFDAASGVRI